MNVRKVWMWLQARKASKRLQVQVRNLQGSEEKEMKKLSPKQKKLASAAEPKDKITGDDFKAMKGMKKDPKKKAKKK
jgi:hypothetical protein